MGHSLIVVGIGPGSRDYILPKALRTVENARFLAGGRRALADFASPTQETYPVTGQLSALAEWIARSLQEDDVVVMVSGDPGYYSLLPWLKKRFDGISIEVIPGISSVQAAFALMKESWQDGQWLSFHGRVPSEEALRCEPGKKLAFLTDKEQNPAYIAAYLLNRGWPKETEAFAAEHISYENQKVVSCGLEEMTKMEGFFESVMVVKAP